MQIQWRKGHPLLRLSDINIVNKMDSNKYIIGLRDKKKINLKTLEVSDRVKEDYISNITNVSYTDKSCKKVEQFFKQLMPDDECREYMRRVLGYSLSGDVTGRAFFVWWGHGSNGKSALFDLLQTILGDMYHQCDKSIFMKTREKSAGACPEIIAIKGKRFLFTQKVRLRMQLK